MAALKIIELISKSSKSAGVHCFINNEGQYVFSCVIVKRKSDGYELVSKLKETSDVKELAKICSGLPVILSLDGKGIIHKKTRVLDSTNIIDKLFPGFNSSQFYVQKYPTLNSEIFASICRKEQLDELIELLRVHSILITDVILGPFSITDSSSDTEIFTGKQRIRVSKGKIYEIEKSDSRESGLQINTQHIIGNELISYKNAIQHFSITAFESDIEKSTFQNEYKLTKLLKFSGIAGLLIIFFVLLGNFFVFDHYNKKYDQLDQQLVFNAGLSRKLETLKKEYQSKQELLNRSGILQKTRISFYIYELIDQMPSDIKLRSISYQPLEGKIKDKEEVAFKRSIVKILGVSRSGEPVNKWLTELKKFDWIKDASLENYTQEDFDVPGEFELQLSINIK